MSKIKEEKLTNPMDLNIKEIGVIDKNHEDILSSPIYKAENLYYQYLRDLKLKNFNDTSDFSAAFMTF